MTRLPVVRCDKSPPGVASVGWGRPRCAGRRVASSEDTALASTSTTVVVALIYAGTVVLYVGTTALIVRAWTRRRNWHGSPSDLHYIAVSAALLVSAGIAIVVASLIVTALGYSR
jgi:hypothetical protein